MSVMRYRKVCTRSAVLISSNNEEENSWETKIILNQVNSDSEI